MRRKGMRRTKVKADRTARSGFGGRVDVSFKHKCQIDGTLQGRKGLTGLFGDAEKNTRGRIRSVAVATDARDNILKDRYFAVFVVKGWTDPLRAAYSGRVDEDVNAKAIAAMKL